MGLLTLISLGIWQVERLEWKRDLIDTIQQNRHLPALAVTVIDDLNSVSDYQLIKLRAATINSQSYFYVYGKNQNNQAGKWLVLSVNLANVEPNVNMLLAIGWLPHDVGISDSEITALYQRLDNIVITARAHPVLQANFMTPKNQPTKNTWFYIDPKAMLNSDIGHYMVLNDYDFSYIITDLRSIDSLMQLPRNEHLHYAITWFGLALIWLVMGGIFYYRMQRA